ncbi:phage major capsid protein, P2 family [Comamonas jiangduensis]|uniref:Phage major capsid protein, P2 family n=1 Tax=Comamonas jiangduensis TaxID=1194168 RepID=A0ABV4IFB8_9BURK|nr:phage major capsid protein, P2 family [Comamonas jiangduensis]
MRNETRKLFNGYLGTQAKLNGVDNAATQFNVQPSVQQTLETKLQESSAFLSKINIIGVDELKGEKIGLSITRPVASRTDTSGNGTRKTVDPTTLGKEGYECVQVNYDTHIRYAKLDAWAKHKDFQPKISGAIVERCALDRIMIGFNGVSAAADTDIATNPLLQDVAKGWLQHIRENAAQRVMSGVKWGNEAADYKTLDGLVFDAVQLLDTVHQDDPNLVAIVGRGLMHDKLFPLVDDQSAPTEKLAADIVISQRRLGGLPAVKVPYFPEGTVLITSLDNLSIYFQNGSRRRHVKDTPERDRVETYESSNDAWVVEDFGMVALVEGITEYQAPEAPVGG